jgi:hypothetical protein
MTKWRQKLRKRARQLPLENYILTDLRWEGEDAEETGLEGLREEECATMGETVEVVWEMDEKNAEMDVMIAVIIEVPVVGEEVTDVVATDLKLLTDQDHSSRWEQTMWKHSLAWLMKLLNLSKHKLNSSGTREHKDGNNLKLKLSSLTLLQKLNKFISQNLHQMVGKLNRYLKTISRLLNHTKVSLNSLSQFI